MRGVEQVGGVARVVLPLTTNPLRTGKGECSRNCRHLRHPRHLSPPTEDAQMSVTATTRPVSLLRRVGCAESRQSPVLDREDCS